MSIYDNYPTIKKAVIELAYDNGAIHRDRTEQRCLNEMEAHLLEMASIEPLQPYETELAALPEEQFIELLTGESETVMVTASLHMFINAIFEEV